MSEPVEKTADELKEILLEEIRDILRNNVTVDALRDPKSMTYVDVIPNIHLYERLGVAMAALGALHKYKGQPRGFKVIDPF